MSQKILQINFKFNVLRAEYEAAVAPLAAPIAEMPGLIWKVWLMNEAEQEAGGIYLFETEVDLDAYLQSDIVAGIVSHPALSDFSVKRFEPMAGVSQVTAAPLARNMSV